jgi:hypothetical protein
VENVSSRTSWQVYKQFFYSLIYSVKIDFIFIKKNKNARTKDV